MLTPLAKNPPPKKNPTKAHTGRQHYLLTIMGKTNVDKRKQPGTSPPTFSSFFTPQGPRPHREAGNNSTADPNMAPAGPVSPEALQEAAWQPALQDLKADLLNSLSQLETSLAEKVTTLIAPLTAQLQDFKSTLNEVTQTADTAMELGLAAQDHSRLTQQHCEWVAKRIMHLNNQLRAHNVKLHGFEKGAEGEADTVTFVAQWVVSVLHLEERVLPPVDAAFHLGPARKTKASAPRDIIVKFANTGSKAKI